MVVQAEDFHCLTQTGSTKLKILAHQPSLSQLNSGWALRILKSSSECMPDLSVAIYVAVKSV